MNPSTVHEHNGDYGQLKNTERSVRWLRPIPAFVISLDLELHWGMHDKRDPHEYADNLEGARHASRQLLKLFKSYSIHATWAAVGILMCSGREQAMCLSPTQRPSYDNVRRSPYGLLSRCGNSESTDPFHFAPSLAKDVLSAPGQELGCHTFSHYLCLEPGQTPEQFREDLSAAARIAQEYGTRFYSLVFPRNQVNTDYIDIARSAGVLCYRGIRSHWPFTPGGSRLGQRILRLVRLADAYLPIFPYRLEDVSPKEVTGVVDIPATRFLRPFARRLTALNRMHVARIKHEMHQAARSQSTYHLWWHPHNFGKETESNLEILDSLLAYRLELDRTYGFPSMNMHEAASALRAANVTS